MARKVILSSFSEQERNTLASLIQKIPGGVFINSSFYIPDCDIIVCKCPGYGEKYLGGCVSGKPLLIPSYLADCEKAGKWLKKSTYEWCNQTSTSNDDNLLRTLPRRCKAYVQENNGKLVFEDWKVLLHIRNKVKRAAYKRLLESGGAKILNLNPPFHSQLKHIISHIFVTKEELKDVNLLHQIQFQNILYPEYIAEYLTHIQISSPLLKKFLHYKTDKAASGKKENRKSVGQQTIMDMFTKKRKSDEDGSSQKRFCSGEEVSGGGSSTHSASIPSVTNTTPNRSQTKTFQFDLISPVSANSLNKSNVITSSANGISLAGTIPQTVNVSTPSFSAGAHLSASVTIGTCSPKMTILSDSKSSFNNDSLILIEDSPVKQPQKQDTFSLPSTSDSFQLRSISVGSVEEISCTGTDSISCDKGSLIIRGKANSKNEASVIATANIEKKDYSTKLSEDIHLDSSISVTHLAKTDISVPSNCNTKNSTCSSVSDHIRNSVNVPVSMENCNFISNENCSSHPISNRSLIIIEDSPVKQKQKGNIQIVSSEAVNPTLIELFSDDENSNLPICTGVSKEDCGDSHLSVDITTPSKTSNSEIISAEIIDIDTHVSLSENIKDLKEYNLEKKSVDSSCCNDEGSHLGFINQCNLISSDSKNIEYAKSLHPRKNILKTIDTTDVHVPCYSRAESKLHINHSQYDSGMADTVKLHEVSTGDKSHLDGISRCLNDQFGNSSITHDDKEKCSYSELKSCPPVSNCEGNNEEGTGRLSDLKTTEKCDGDKNDSCDNDICVSEFENINLSEELNKGFHNMKLETATKSSNISDFRVHHSTEKIKEKSFSDMEVDADITNMKKGSVLEVSNIKLDPSFDDSKRSGFSTQWKCNRSKEESCNKKMKQTLIHSMFPVTSRAIRSENSSPEITAPSQRCSGRVRKSKVYPDFVMPKSTQRKSKSESINKFEYLDNSSSSSKLSQRKGNKLASFDVKNNSLGTENSEKSEVSFSIDENKNGNNSKVFSEISQENDPTTGIHCSNVDFLPIEASTNSLQSDHKVRNKCESDGILTNACDTISPCKDVGNIQLASKPSEIISDGSIDLLASKYIKPILQDKNIKLNNIGSNSFEEAQSSSTCQISDVVPFVNGECSKISGKSSASFDQFEAKPDGNTVEKIKMSLLSFTTYLPSIKLVRQAKDGKKYSKFVKRCCFSKRVENMIDISMDQSNFKGVFKAIKENTSSFYFPSARVISFLFNQLMDSASVLNGSQVYCFLNNVVLLHPVTEIVDVYFLALQKPVEDESGIVNGTASAAEYLMEIITLVSNTFKKDFAERTKSDKNQVLLLEYVVSLLLGNFIHASSSILNNINNKKSALEKLRKTLIWKIIWGTSQDSCVNKNVKELIHLVLGLVAQSDSEEKYEISLMLMKLITLLGNCCSLKDKIHSGLEYSTCCTNFVSELQNKCVQILFEGENSSFSSKAWFFDHIQPPWLTCRLLEFLLLRYNDELIDASKKHIMKKPLSLEKIVHCFFFLHPSLEDSSNVKKKTPLKNIQNTVTSKSKVKKKGRNLNRRNMRGETTLQVACIKNDVAKVKELLSLGANPNIKDYAGWSPLHEACNYGFLGCVEELLKCEELDILITNPDGISALHDAAQNNHAKIVEKLVAVGGKELLELKTALNETAYDLAIGEEIRNVLNTSKCSDKREGNNRLNPEQYETVSTISKSETEEYLYILMMLVHSFISSERSYKCNSMEGGTSEVKNCLNDDTLKKQIDLLEKHIHLISTQLSITARLYLKRIAKLLIT